MGFNYFEGINGLLNGITETALATSANNRSADMVCRKNFYEKSDYLIEKLYNDFLPPLDREDLYKIILGAVDLNNSILDIPKQTTQTSDIAELNYKLKNLCEGLKSVGAEFAFFKKRPAILKKIHLQKILYIEALEKTEFMKNRTVQAYRRVFENGEKLNRFFELAVLKNI